MTDQPKPDRQDGDGLLAAVRLEVKIIEERYGKHRGFLENSLHDDALRWQRLTTAISHVTPSPTRDGVEPTPQTILLRQARDYIRQYIKELGGCDHLAGICCCADIELAERIEAVVGDCADEAVPIGEGTLYWRTLRAALSLPIEDQHMIATDLAANCGYELTGDAYTALTAPVPPADGLTVPLADHDEIGRKVSNQPWEIQSAIVTITAHCTVLTDKHPTGEVADLAGCISQCCSQLADALTSPSPAVAAEPVADALTPLDRPSRPGEKRLFGPAAPPVRGDREAAIEECAKLVEGTGLRNPDNIARDIRALSRQAPHSSSESGR